MNESLISCWNDTPGSDKNRASQGVSIEWDPLISY